VKQKEDSRQQTAGSLLSRCWLLFLLFAIAANALALDIPPEPKNWFTDAAGVVSSSDAEQLNQKLHSFEQQSGVRFMVYVFPALDGEEPADFTIRCAEQWKVWRSKKEDRALLLTVFVKEHKIRLEVSYPLEEKITDAASSDIIRNTIAPHFRQNDYAGGIGAGIDAVGTRLGVQGMVSQQPARRTYRDAGDQGGGFDLGWLVVIAFIVIFFILPMLTRGRSGCGGCFWPMFFLGGGGGGGGITFGGGGGGGGGFSSGGFGGGGSFGGGGATGGW